MSYGKFQRTYFFSCVHADKNYTNKFVHNVIPNILIISGFYCPNTNSHYSNSRCDVIWWLEIWTGDWSKYKVTSFCLVPWQLVAGVVHVSRVHPSTPSEYRLGRHWEPPAHGSDCLYWESPRFLPYGFPLCPWSSEDSYERSAWSPSKAVCIHSLPLEFYHESRNMNITIRIFHWKV